MWIRETVNTEKNCEMFIEKDEVDGKSFVEGFFIDNFRENYLNVL